MENRRLKEDLLAVFNYLKWIRAQRQAPLLQQKDERPWLQAAGRVIPNRYVKNISPFGGSSTRTDSSEEFWDLHPWRCSELDRIRH